MVGVRSRKSSENLVAGCELRRMSVESRKCWPVFALKTPSSSKRENTSAESTSAHL